MLGHRIAQPHELPGVATFVVEAYRQFSGSLMPENWERMERGLAAAVKDLGDGLPLVAEDEGVLCGFVAYFRPGCSDPSLFPPGWASLRLLAVGPAMRGRGIGKHLMDACVARACSDGATVLGLHTSELMTTARGMYERMGFEIVRELPRRVGVRYWLFRLDLGGD